MRTQKLWQTLTVLSDTDKNAWDLTHLTLKSVKSHIKCSVRGSVSDKTVKVNFLAFDVHYSNLLTFLDDRFFNF